MLAFTVAVSLLTGILFGLAPAAQVSKLDLNEALKEAGRASEGRRRGLTRSLVVVAEMALALVLLIGATLMIRTFVALEQASTGFPTENLLTMNVMLPEEQYSNEQQVSAGFQRVLDRIQSITGVFSAASATNLPVGGWNQGRAFTIEGRAPKSPGEIQGTPKLPGA